MTKPPKIIQLPQVIADQLIGLLSAPELETDLRKLIRGVVDPMPIFTDMTPKQKDAVVDLIIVYWFAAGWEVLEQVFGQVAVDGLVAHTMAAATAQLSSQGIPATDFENMKRLGQEALDSLHKKYHNAPLEIEETKIKYH